MQLDPADVRVLADAERAGGGTPDGCAWLDERTVGDLDLDLVFRAVDRSIVPSGAQALWRWLVAPARERRVLAAREAKLGVLDPVARERIRSVLEPRAIGADAQLVPKLLWGAPAKPFALGLYVTLVGALAACVVLGWWMPILWGVAVALFAANVMIDDWANTRLAHHARALEVLSDVLGMANKLRTCVPSALGDVAEDLAAVSKLRNRLGVLTIRDPLEIASVLRAGFLVRLFVLASCLSLIDRQRAHLRRIVLWVGEIDALRSIAVLRAEREDCQVPALDATDRTLEARALVHPAIEACIGNDLVLADTDLLVTGSNMSGKSTFLRTLAVNAICAQSIHTTFGAWRACMLRVHAVMRTADDPAHGQSTFAVEVSSIGALLAKVSNDDDIPALFLLDEPFTGTNPSVRVSIAVAVLDYLAARDIVVAATHDLEVAARVDPKFLRAHFLEIDELAGEFDRKLRDGVAPSTNAVALLRRAGYPDAVLARIR